MPPSNLPQPNKIQRYGWKPDPPDHRDMLMRPASLDVVAALPPEHDLSTYDPEAPYDQGQLGSCTANGIGHCVQFERKKQGLDAWRPSRLFIYYWERYIEGTVNEDSGAIIRDGMKVVSKYGAPPETLWPYDTEKYQEEPPEPVQTVGERTQVLQYLRCPHDLGTIKATIFQGYPVVFGFTVFQNFESPEVASSGLLGLPGPNDANLGGHCVVWCGWNDTLQMPDGTKGALKVRNSWGTGWGQGGYFWMSYGYVINPGLATDFWTIREVEPPSEPVAQLEAQGVLVAKPPTLGGLR